MRKINICSTIINLLLSLSGVSLFLFIMARFSAYEWVNPHPCDLEPEELENQFTLLNTLWFTIGCLMCQGCDITPRWVNCISKTLSSENSLFFVVQKGHKTFKMSKIEKQNGHFCHFIFENYALQITLQIALQKRNFRS